MIKDLFGIQMIVNVNVIYMLENVYIMKIVNVDKLVEECSENIDGNEMIYNRTINDYEKYVILVQYK